MTLSSFAHTTARCATGELEIQVRSRRLAGFLERFVLQVELVDVPHHNGELVCRAVQSLLQVGAVAGDEQLALPQRGAFGPQAQRHREVHAERPVGELAELGRDPPAAGRAPLQAVPAVEADGVEAGECGVLSDEKLLQTALIENIQREDLNAIEEALAYKRLGDESGMTQEEIAAAVGKDRATVANHLRLLKLPDQVRARVANGELSMGHARALLAIEDQPTLLKAADQVIAGGLSVRATEALARKLTEPKQEPAATPAAAEKDVHTRQAEDRLRMVLGTRVTINRKGKGGRVEIEFVNEDELIRLYEYLVER